MNGEGVCECGVSGEVERGRWEEGCEGREGGRDIGSGWLHSEKKLRDGLRKEKGIVKQTYVQRY